MGSDKKPSPPIAKDPKIIGPSHQHGEDPPHKRPTPPPQTFIEKKSQSGG